MPHLGTRALGCRRSPEVVGSDLARGKKREKERKEEERRRKGSEEGKRERGKREERIGSFEFLSGLNPDFKMFSIF